MSENNSIKVVRLSGELEIARKDEIRAALASAEQVTPVLLDLAGVTYADSIALTELLRFCIEAEHEHRRVALVIQSPQFSRLVQYAGLASAFKIFDDSERARAYLDDGEGR